MRLKAERIRYWISVGAQPSDRCVGGVGGMGEGEDSVTAPEQGIQVLEVVRDQRWGA